jgi:DNA-binding MarR family transcriptional regulator
MQPIEPLVATLEEWTEVFMHRSMRNFILFAKETGLSMPQIGALFHLLKSSGGVTELGEELGVTSAAASQMLERLVQLKLIVRSEAPHDRRAKVIILTDKGQQTLKDSIRARQGWLNDLAQTLTPAETEQVVAALKILIEKARMLGQPSPLEQ